MKALRVPIESGKNRTVSFFDWPGGTVKVAGRALNMVFVLAIFEIFRVSVPVFDTVTNVSFH